jgi:ankyrin repeat protein
MTDGRKWYYMQKGERKGPVGDEQAVELVKNGSITPKTRVWVKEINAWADAGNTDLFTQSEDVELPPPDDDEPPEIEHADSDEETHPPFVEPAFTSRPEIPAQISQSVIEMRTESTSAKDGPVKKKTRTGFFIAVLVVLLALGALGQKDNPDTQNTAPSNASEQTPSTSLEPSSSGTKSSGISAISDEDFYAIYSDMDWKSLVKVEKVEEALKSGANVNAKNNNGGTALSWFTMFNNPEAVSLLLKYGADVNAKDNSGGTALMLANSNFNAVPAEEVVSLLLKHGADVNAKDNDGRTALMRICGSPEVISLLLKNGADVNAKDNDGRTALIHAILNNLTLLAESKVELLSMGWDDLHYVPTTEEVVSLLLKYGADINVKNEDGRTALMLAAGYDNLDEAVVIVSLLLENGADASAEDNDGRTALEIARDPKVISLLRQYEEKQPNRNAPLPQTAAELSKTGQQAFKIPPDRDLAHLSVSGNNVNVRAAPNMKGAVAFQVDDIDEFIAERAAVTDPSDKSKWHRLFFRIWGESGAGFLKTPLYISANFASVLPLTNSDKNELEWFRKGRPPLLSLEEDASLKYAEEIEYMRPYSLSRPIILLTAPESGAGKIDVARGTQILFVDGAGSLFGEHLDLNDERWIALIGANRKVLGWIRWAELADMLESGLLVDIVE